MLSTLLLNNIHLGVELLGGVIFIIIGWLFAEAFAIKRDRFSFARLLGFWLLAAWQVLHAIYGEEAAVISITAYIYIAGLALIFLSYLEKLPERPGDHRFRNLAAGLTVPAFIFSAAGTALLLGTAFFLYKRFIKDIDKLIKWLFYGFAFLALASLISSFTSAPFGAFWLVEHALKIIGLVALLIWAWQWLSLRIKEEVLIVFIGASLFIALVVTTAFSTIFVKRLGTETRNSLASSAKVLDFYVENLKNGALAASQITAGNADFASAAKAGDIGDLTKIGGELLEETGEQFLVVAKKNGAVNFKLNATLESGENILSERIGANALEGRPAVAISGSAEGLSVRAAAPIFDRGAIIGAAILGTRLDKEFAENLKKISGFETVVWAAGKTLAATIALPDEAISKSMQQLSAAKESTLTIRVRGEEILGSSLSLLDVEGKLAGNLLLTTSPGSLIQESQRSNRLTLLVAIIIIFSLIVPLYRFTMFLTQ